MKIKLTTPEYCFYCLLLIITLIIPRELNGKNLDVLLSNPFLLEINNSPNTPSLTMIPVAFHIIKKSNGTGEVTDEQIHLQIDVLNYAFSLTNYRFTLYDIDRTTNDYWANAQFDSNAEQDMKYNLAIDPSHVLNIYTCVLDYAGGYSRFPWDYPENNYMHGCVINYTTIVDGGDEYQDLGDVCVHEVGHYMGLLHTFENCVTTAGDSISDTPPQESPTDPNDNCSTIIDYCEGYTGSQLANNYMDYSADLCKDRFTAGQIARMNQKMAQLKPSMNGWYITLEQRKESNELMSGTSVGIWEPEISAFENVNIPSTPIKTSVGDNKILQGNQFLFSSEKFNRWTIGGLIGGSFTEEADVTNHHIFTIGDDQATYISQFKHSYSGTTIKNSLEGTDATGGSIYFKDPWYIDQVDPAYGNNLKNRGLNPFPRQRSSDPFNPDYNTVFQNGSDPSQSYKGVFLNQPYTGNNPVYYSVKVDQEQTIPINGVNHKFFFQNWSGTDVQFQYPNALETGVVFTDGSAVVNANLKGVQVSNYSGAYNNNGQRKFVRTDDGYLHHVYESMGKVFYELSSDGGANWQIINMPGWEGISPSIDYFSNFTVVAFQISSIPIDVIEIYSFKRINNTYSLADYLNTNYGVHNIYASKPVIALSWGDGFGYESPIFTVVWCDYQNEYQPGLYGVAGTLDLNNGYLEYLTTSPVTYLTGTSANSLNPTISTSKLAGTVFHLAWQQTTSGNNSKINYGILYITGQNTISLSSIQNISLGNGFGQNITPSIIEYPYNSQSIAKITWVGIRQVDENPVTEYKTFYRSLESGTFKSFGDVARFPVINKTNNNNAFAISWNESNSNTNKFTPSWKSLRYIYPLNVDGKAVQLNNGSSYNGSSNSSGMFGMVFSESTTPYTFSKSLDLASLTPPEKITGTSIALGREGVIYKDSAQFYFAVGDIILNNQSIDFVDLPDTVFLSDNEMLNQYLYSIPFEVNDNSILYYTVQYGISDSVSAVNVLHLNDYLSFKVELIDDLSGEVLGQYDDVTFTKTNVAQYDNISYKVNTEGIGNRYVRLRLTTSNNFNPSYSITQRFADESVLGKSSLQEVNYKGSLGVDTYDLAQNYPNPFNPSTTIKYQIPNAGNVSLKIYDILGREVTTLVDEFKNEGKYEVNFNANKLASGVYIYTIKSNEFTASKKLMLLK